MKTFKSWVEFQEAIATRPEEIKNLEESFAIQGMNFNRVYPKQVEFLSSTHKIVINEDEVTLSRLNEDQIMMNISPDSDVVEDLPPEEAKKVMDALDSIEEENVIKEIEVVTFREISGDYKARIDTGAKMTSMHAENVQVDGNTVSFETRHSRVKGVPLAGMVDVKTSDSVEKRPIVTLTVNIEGQTLPNVDINLNDRSKMDEDVLIGRNVLKAGGFLVDVTNANESVDEDNIDIDNEPDEPDTN